MNKKKIQTILLNKLLSVNINDIREALTALSGFALAKKEWALSTVNTAIIMMEYVDKKYYTTEKIENKEINNFFIMKNAQYRALLFSQSTIGNRPDYSTENTIFNETSWLKVFNDLVLYPKVMLDNFYRTQEIILACSGKTEEVAQSLKNSTDEKLAVRFFELFRGQMEIQSLFDGVNREVAVCKHCGGRRFEVFKYSMLCKDCGKHMSNQPIYYLFEAICGIGFCMLSLRNFQNSEDEFGGILFLALGIVSIVPLLSALYRKLQGVPIRENYNMRNKKFNLNKENLFEILRNQWKY